VECNLVLTKRKTENTGVCVCVCVLSVLDFLFAFPYSDDLITNSVPFDVTV